MKFKIFLFLMFVAFFGNAQVFYTVKTLSYSNGKVSAINSTGKVIFQVNCKDMIYYQQQDLTIGVFDYQTLTSRIFINSSITSPAYANVIDSLKSWQSQCNNTGTAIPIPLIVNNVGIDTVRVLDSVRVYFNPQVSDTANQAILLSIHNLLKDSLDKNIFVTNDSLKVWFSQPLEVKSDTANNAILQAIFDILVDSLDKNIYVNNDSLKVYFSQPIETKTDTANQFVLNSIFDILKDSLDKQLYVLNPYIDSAVIRRMDTIIDRLTSTAKLDTMKGLVYTAIAKVRTNRDTLYNCKSISFGRKSNASGTLVLTYENGESESFDVANDDLPTWVNGSFISYLDYNATGAVGLIVNTLGCSQTDTEICAKIKPIFDCELVIPIGCLGWQSASGVWQSVGGCWNTGQ